MQEVVKLTLDETKMKKEFIECHTMYMKANTASNVNLPCKAVNGGNVLHGARVEMEKMARYWETRKDAVSQYLSREWITEKECELDEIN